MTLVLGCILAYLLGAVPFALLLVKLLRGVDVRQIGSGNVGATNASRAFPPGMRVFVFLAVYVLDFTKGFLPAWAGSVWLQGGAAASAALGASAVLGHCTSPYLGFRGGKGVATTTGVMAWLDPLALGAALACWLIVRFATGQVFLGSLALGVSLAAAVFLRDPHAAFGERLPVTVFAIAAAIFFFVTHRSNLRAAFSRHSAEKPVS